MLDNIIRRLRPWLTVGLLFFVVLMAARYMVVTQVVLPQAERAAAAFDTVGKAIR